MDSRVAYESLSQIRAQLLDLIAEIEHDRADGCLLDSGADDRDVLTDLLLAANRLGRVGESWKQAA